MKSKLFSNLSKKCVGLAWFNFVAYLVSVIIGNDEKYSFTLIFAYVCIIAMYVLKEICKYYEDVEKVKQ